MEFKPDVLPALIKAATEAVAHHAEEVTALDQAIGDGDHVINLQRGLQALMEQREALAQLDWCSAWQKIGMILMSTVGGASGSLFGTLFVTMGKAAIDQPRRSATGRSADFFNSAHHFSLFCLLPHKSAAVFQNSP